MKKVLLMVLVCAMMMSLAACGAKPAEAPAEQAAPAAEASAVPEGAVIPASEDADAIVNPATLNLGVSKDETHSGDAWYKDGTSPDDYIYFGYADNSSSGLVCVHMVNGAPARTWLCKATVDNHLLDQEAEEGKSEIDIVFPDIFTAVNTLDGTKYVRGNADTLSQLFVGKNLVEKENSENTLIFNADGTGKEVYDGKEYDLKWEIDSGSTVKFTDGENEFSMTIEVDDNGNFVSLYNMNFRTYVPAA